MPDLADLYPGFASSWIDTAAGRIFARTGGEGPPLLLLHGYPQTNVMWHRVAPALARLQPDHSRSARLRLVGRPASDAEHAPYTKRAMARAMIEVMEALGHVRFASPARPRRPCRLSAGARSSRAARAARGARHRADLGMWHRMDARLANRAWHWMFLALPAPFPETLIGKARCSISSTARRPEPRQEPCRVRSRALAHYHAFFDDPVRIHATCEDYRAGRTTDLAHDEASRAAGEKIACPLLAIWGAAGGIPAETRSARDLARMGARRARLSARLRALSRRGGAGGDGARADRVFHRA